MADVERQKTAASVPIGREAVFSAIELRYRKAQCADGGALIVSGDAGIGKSRVLESFVRVHEGDGRVFAPAPLDAASSPFAPVAHVIEQLLHARGELFDLHPGLREAVGRLLDADLAGVPPSAGERRRCFEAAARLFRLASADAPTTLVIDDLHNADVALLHLLRQIVAVTERSAFLLVAAYRTGAAREDVAAELARLEALDNVTHCRVEPLARAPFEEVVRAMCGADVAKDVRARIVERAEGNPLFARELVRQALSGAAGETAVPRSIAQSVLERFLILPARERETVSVAAALGRSFDVRVLARVTAETQEHALETMRDANRIGLVEQTAQPHVLRFPHALVQEAIYGDMLEAQRRSVHRRIFDALRGDAASIETIYAIAYHSFASGDRESTAFYNELAGDHAAANQAFERSVEFYVRAAEVASGDLAASARVLEKLANAYLIVGRPDRAVDPASRVLAYRRERGDVAGTVEALFILANVAGQIGEDELRLERLSEARELLGVTRDPALLGKRSLCDSEISLAERNAVGVIASCAAAAEESGIDPSDAIALRNAHAHALLLERRYREAILTQAEAVRFASKSGNSEQLSSSRFGLGAVLALSGQMSRASRAFERAARIAADRWALSERSLSLACAAEMELIGGRLAGARTFLDQALADSRYSDHSGVVVAIGRVGIFLGLRTNDTKLLSTVAAALDLDTLFRERTPAQYFALSGAYSQYLLSIERGAEAAEILRRAVRRLSVKRLRSTDWSVCSMLTVAEHGGEADLAAARKPIADWFAPHAPAFTHLFDGIVAARRGDTEAVARHGAAAIDDFRRYGFAYEQGVALEFAGRKREALDIMQACGFRADADRLREDLTPRNRRGRASDALTKRELEVARLVAEHLTNREIADRLFVSEKTVETHLASVFAKLGVSSRAGVAERHTVEA